MDSVYANRRRIIGSLFYLRAFHVTSWSGDEVTLRLDHSTEKSYAHYFVVLHVPPIDHPDSDASLSLHNRFPFPIDDVMVV